MLIILWNTLFARILPAFGAQLEGLITVAGVIAIMGIGLMVCLSAVGVHFSLAPVANGVFHGFGYLVDHLFRTVAWLAIMACGLIPGMFRGIRDFALNAGISRNWSTVIGLVASAAIIAVVI